MQSSLKKQAEAIKKAMEAREQMFSKTNVKMKPDNAFYTVDEQWELLNDAYSTIISLQLNETLKQTNHEKRRSVFNGW